MLGGGGGGGLFCFHCWLDMFLHLGWAISSLFFKILTLYLLKEASELGRGFLLLGKVWNNCSWQFSSLSNSGSCDRAQTENNGPQTQLVMSVSHFQSLFTMLKWTIEIEISFLCFLLTSFSSVSFSNSGGSLMANNVICLRQTTVPNFEVCNFN